MADVEMQDVPAALPVAVDAKMAAAPKAPRRMLQPKLKRFRASQVHDRESCNPSAKQLYPDRYVGPGPTAELSSLMDGLDVNNSAAGGGNRAGGNRKRRRGESPEQRRVHVKSEANEYTEDDDGHERRPQRKPRYQQPIAARLRNELLQLGENASRVQDDVVSMGNDIALNFDDDQVRGDLLDILIQLVVEQPLKIPALSSVVLYVNDKTPEAVEEIIVRAGRKAQAAVIAGNWRDFKLVLRLFALFQGILEGDGVLPIFDELFDRVVDLQSKSTTDTLGPEFVKIILLTIPYLMVSNAHDLNAKVKDVLIKTAIVANEKQPFQDLVETYTGGSERKQSRSSLFLLQAQLQAQVEQGWPMRFMPRLYQSQGMANGDGDEASSKKHSLPAVTFPEHINPGPKALFPEAFFSIYANQDIATVAPTSDLACSLIRDTLVDTINVLHFNRNAVAKFLVEMDCYWAPGTFAKRGTPVDKLVDFDDSQSVWKPEDMTLDALFSQIFSLPAPEHKLVYYHSVTTELCRLSPSTIAPCLGRAMRFLFRNIADMDIELAYRFTDWFAQHLSNFEFRWKWDEWQENLNESNLHPKKAFIIGAIDKEIRLSFVKRIRDTLPQPYHELITDGKEKDTPDFKYKFESTPFAAEGQEILSLLRKKAPDAEIEAVVDRIQHQATQNGIPHPEIPSTDAYMTSICYIGSKSLSHVLSCIERCREYLVRISTSSPFAADQIIQSVIDYWVDHPGTAVNIIDKLLNYTIVTPEGVLYWALRAERLDGGAKLAEHWRYEMVSATMGKVTNRVRQIAAHLVLSHSDLSTEDREKVMEALREERQKMAHLFEIIISAVAPMASGEADAFIEADFGEEQEVYVRNWAMRWSKAFTRKQDVELALVSDEAVAARIEIAKTEREEQKKIDAEEQARIDAEEAEKAAKREAERKAEAEAVQANGDGQNGEGRNGDIDHNATMDNLDVDEGV